MHTAHIAIDPQTKACRIQTCTEHSRSVTGLTKGILAPCGLGSAGYLAGLLHDCGKFTDEFDDYIARASNNEPVHKGSVIHTFAGVRCIMELFHIPNEQSMENIVAEVIAICIGSHHGLIDLWDERHQGGFDHRLKHQPAYDRRAIASFYQEFASKDEIIQLFSEAQKEITGEKKYVYYVCSAHKQNKSYAPHRMRDTVLEEIVGDSLKQHISISTYATKLLLYCFMGI